MASYNSADILCPFYLRDDPKTCTLTCEGVLPGSSVKSHFGDGASLRGQLGKYCAAAWQSCPWSRLVDLQYRD